MKADEFIAGEKDYISGVSLRDRADEIRCVNHALKVIPNLIAIIESQRASLRRIGIKDCGCGVPCDCYSWRVMAAIAEAELGKEW
jgi:hypothetical protein